MSCDTIGTTENFNQMSDETNELNNNNKAQIKLNRNNDVKFNNPPIKITNKTENELKDILKQLNVINYKLTKMHIGIKLLLFGDDSYYKSLLNKLKCQNCQFYTHNRRGKKPYKVVLYGLEETVTNTSTAVTSTAITLNTSNSCASIYNNIKMPTPITNDMLIEILTNNFDLPVLDVKKLILKKYKYSKKSFYLIFLKNKSITIKYLNEKIKNLFGKSIHWDEYHVNPNFVPQCRNCYMFGHGSSFCNMKTTCPYCSNYHSIKDCNVKNIPEKWKCINCGENHSATDPLCYKRSIHKKLKKYRSRYF